MPEQQEQMALKVFRDLEFEEYVGKFPDFRYFGENLPPKFRRLFDNLTTSMGIHDPSHKAMEYTAVAEFWYPLYIALHAGFRTFRVSSELAMLIKDTDIPDVALEFFKLPFEGIVLDVPKSTFSGKYKIVSRIYACRLDDDERFRTSFVDELSATSYMNMLMPEGATIKDAVDKTTQHDKLMAVADPDAWKYHVGDTFEVGAQSELFRFIINAILYISSPDADVKEDVRERHALHQKMQGMGGGNKRRKLEASLKKAKAKHIYIVGRRWDDDEEYEKVASVRFTEEGRKILKRFRVRGHFRLQPYGKGRELRKISWVRPHWKGPTFAELVQNGYVVK
jgi:hypothetical protein